MSVAAFQAVNAADIRGRTLHNACGLGVDAAALDRAVSQEAAKRMSYWRWLVVDEISMVNARLLAQAHENGTVEQRLRAVVPSASQWKRGVAGESRPFAGVNVLLLGDFYQLPPPSGGYLADVPSSRRPPRLSAAADAEPDLLADYGRNLVWGGALQGVTELEERERCKDDWWNEVVDELRRGELSEENWRYLHGKPVAGCRLTAAERESRRRVIAGPGDPRLGEEKFRWAAAIVANNDAKYQINKDRAEDYSRAAESPLRWSVALDAPSAEVLQTQECDKAARVRWLQYHDRDTENLSGMLPLAVGMRVVLADHLDRAEDKLLLRGSAGRVHSWVWKENDLRPTCVYVKFDGAAWQLDGAPEPGLYPVYPARKVWKLDAKRKKPVLKIARTQLPLALAYAITAHGSQGKTLPAALVDFNVDKRTDVTFGTVAASRVRSREDVLILRSCTAGEVRKTMRLQTHAYRVCYGTSIFLTFSPSERDTALMLRLARVREEDPALLRDGAKKFQARGAPALDEEFCRLSPEALAESLPNYEDRRALLARDPLACAEGFRTLVLLTLRHLLGVRFCPRCPNCAASERPCSDAFGSNALATGGVLGRVDAVFGSIECQKSGTLHAHLQVFVQCRHQRGSLAGLLDLGKPELQTLLQRYASYTAHVRRSVYCDPDGWERDRAAAEEEWPEYKDCALMLSRPAYQASRRLRPEEWTQRYLAEDVEQLQRRKQHHVHLPAGPGGERRPLAHCRDFKDPTRCKSGFPRDSQLILGRTALVCHGLAEQLDLPVKGKRSSLGLQWGPVNDYHAALTDAGAAKLDRSARANLQPGVDYKIREEGGEDWLPLGRGALAQKFRHDWVLAPRSRPHVPVVQGALGGRSEVDYARCVLLLFCPWTTHPDDASAAVPYLGDLCKLGETDWRRALRDAGESGEEDGEVEDEVAATRLCIMTKQMFDLSRAAWKTGGTASASPGPRRAQPGPARPKDEELDHDAIAQAARASRGKSRLPLLPGIGVAPQDPEAQPLGPRVTADGLLGWLGSERVRSGLNGKQLELLRVVVERVLVELELVPPDHEIALRRAEPLAWLLHGPPGTGKSHVLKFLRDLFEEQLGYAQGIDYEVAAFQAVNAADIRGRTLHNACGLGVDAAALDRAVSQEAAKRMSYWRWLVVDEISMVNARLLAQVEQRLRAVVPSASQWKRGVAGESRPFAGVNVLLLGDFYQLPPPSGGYLADVPSSRRPPRLSTAADAEPDLLADYGRNLVWGGALQGVTELEERERCKDDWWNEVVDELRRGELSEENWRYLHGKPVAGCRLTAAERESRRRVIAGPGDPRLGEEKFRWAAAIVANNDAKYQINKDRAEDYSRAAESPLRWSVALDAPSAEVLQTQECDKAARVRWLQYHDRDTENLSGMLPLAVGMRVVLADHLDRAEDKLLLRGSAGRVHSWVWKENDLRPTCVYVKFDGATWQLDGAPEPGLYPVYPARKVWKLDAKRKKPVLKIARTQLPLALAYAITAHGSQGKTLPAALVDFNVDKRTDVTFGTVAASRVRSRKDVLILRPFERWLYTRGAPEGPALLLQQLRGEEVDWEAFRETKAPSATCEKCKERKTLDYFSDRQWERVRANRSAICLACGPSKGGQKTLKRKLPSGLARLDCRGCKSRKLEDAFPRAQLQQDESEA
ncbi:unnamed protein product, partial [Effrenium voratum]